jgi:putative ATPase
MDDVREGRTIPVPRHLRDAHYKGAKRLGAGEGYRYPHEHADSLVEQDYLGVDKTYYTPSDRGFEAAIQERLESWRNSLKKRSEGSDSSGR